jgi:phage gp36-like protein
MPGSKLLAAFGSAMLERVMLIQIAACGSVSKAHAQTALQPAMRFAAVILHYLSLRLPLPSFSLLMPAYIPRG